MERFNAGIGPEPDEESDAGDDFEGEAVGGEGSVGVRAGEVPAGDGGGEDGAGD